MFSGHVTPAPETLNTGTILQSSSASSPAGDTLSALLLQLFGFLMFSVKDRRRRKRVMTGYSSVVIQK